MVGYNENGVVPTKYKKEEIAQKKVCGRTRFATKSPEFSKKAFCFQIRGSSSCKNARIRLGALNQWLTKLVFFFGVGRLLGWQKINIVQCKPAAHQLAQL